MQKKAAARQTEEEARSFSWQWWILNLFNPILQKLSYEHREVSGFQPKVLKWILHNCSPRQFKQQFSLFI